jgi:acetyltransferase-like isoleucine patch superfamily enzyme
MMDRLTSVLAGVGTAGRMVFNRSIPLRHLRNLWKFPGLALDPTVNVRVEGQLLYGTGVRIGEGCNLIVSTGATLELAEDVYIGRYVELGPGGRISVGNKTTVQDRGTFVGDVAIGSYCVISLNVLISSGQHYFERTPHLLIRDQDRSVFDDAELFKSHNRPVVVGDDCWIGVNSVIMPGVTIGRGCVIGSNSVVTKDIPPYSVAMGGPAKVVRTRLNFSPPRELNWAVPEHRPYFYSGFKMSALEWPVSERAGGLVASQHFSIWLASDRGAKICLRVKASAQGAKIESNGTVHDVGTVWEDYVFPAGSVEGAISFLVQSGSIVVSDAWLS